MPDEVRLEQHIKVVKSKQELYAEVGLALFSLGSLYLASNPQIIEDIEQRFNQWREVMAHRLSIWQTIVGIRTLPEKDDDET